MDKIKIKRVPIKCTIYIYVNIYNLLWCKLMLTSCLSDASAVKASGNVIAYRLVPSTINDRPDRLLMNDVIGRTLKSPRIINYYSLNAALV